MKISKRKFSCFNNKVILITGGTGSWGQELTFNLLTDYHPKEIRIYSRGEYHQVDMQRRFASNPKLKFIIGDVKDKNALSWALKDVNYVFHLAALKHIPVCEDNGWQTVLTNIYGTQNVIEASLACGVEKVIDVSTDKAVEPYNLYGVTKACGEKLMIAANKFSNYKTKFICIRSGNVIGTSGSMIPFFIEQIKKNNEITVTDENMTRFLINTKEAIHLILRVAQTAIGGEIFILRMPAATNKTVVKVLVKMFGNKKTKIRKIGRRPGEKMDEVLISKHEVSFTREVDRKLFVILPQNNNERLIEKYKKYPPINYTEFTSKTTSLLSETQLEQLLRKENKDLL